MSSVCACKQKKKRSEHPIQFAASLGLWRFACNGEAQTLALPVHEMPSGCVSKVAKLVQRREAAQNEAQLQRWLESRPAARSVALVSAAERMAVLRRRVAVRAGSAVV